ncbi:MAG: zinc-dependent metalloprotease [Armatimonadetes bacterium]|nr:zinc-dependent metalloprotease [Armatimonadota bacterium]
MSRTLTMLVSFILVMPVFAQPGGSQEPGQRGPRGGSRQEQAGPKPYEEVVTDKAVTQDGVFKVHRIDEKLLFEIPEEQLGKDFLFTTEIAKAPPGGYGGTAAGNRVLRWEKRGDKILLRTIQYRIRSERDGPIRIAIEAANVPPIAMVFDVQAYAENGAAVIDVTKLYTSDVAEFSVRSRLGAGSLDSARSFLEKVKAFPTNIEVESLLTFRQSSSGGGGAGQRSPFGRGGRGGGPSTTALVHYSMVKLPDKPMMGRLADSRVGFFSVRFDDYGTDEHRVASRRFVTRYRLEKKDPDADMSEPVEPIVYYVSREVPAKWREYVRQGIEDWQVAFEQAGFKNAIIGKFAPSVEEDPDWDPEDARYSVIRWAPTTTQNAMGPHVHDPRSGEIISAHVIIWHNILNLLTTWYFTQASACDERAQSIPFPDDLMGELVRYVVAHEVGHTIGLQHNMKASSSYTVAQLRDPEFTATHGTAPSIMDYARFNYVAQPGDGARLIPVVGPYDKFAIEWGYKPIKHAINPADEERELDIWAARQVNNPMLRFGSNSFEDPSQQSEDLGSDGVEATRLGLRNLERVAGFVSKATVRFGKEYSDLEDRYNDIWSQWRRELNHVVAVVGGVEMIDWHAGRGGDVYVPVSRERQKAAMELLCEKALRTPHALLSPDILNKIQPTGAVDRVLSSQRSVLSRLLSDSRAQRILELEARLNSESYTLDEMFTDLRDEIFSELSVTQVKIDVYRRNLQRAYVLILVGKLDNKSTEMHAYALGELKEISALLGKALPKAPDRPTRLHLDDLKTIIKDALEAKVVKVETAAAPAPRFPGRGDGR